PTLIDEINDAVRPEAPGHRGDGVDNKPKPVLALSQRVASALCFDGDPGHLRRHVYQLNVLSRRHPRLAVIHRKRPEHGIVVRENRRRPDRTQTVADRYIAAVLPQSIVSGISRIHGLAPERSGSA